MACCLITSATCRICAVPSGQPCPPIAPSRDYRRRLAAQFAFDDHVIKSTAALRLLGVPREAALAATLLPRGLKLWPFRISPVFEIGMRHGQLTITADRASPTGSRFADLA